eukprot:IDg4716t1
MLYTKKYLQDACRRRCLSCIGKKAYLAARLREKGVTLKSVVLELIDKFKTSVEELGNFRSRPRQPHWTKNEAGRLCNVVADLRFAVYEARLYDCASSLAETSSGFGKSTLSVFSK